MTNQTEFHPATTPSNDLPPTLIPLALHQTHRDSYERRAKWGKVLRVWDTQSEASTPLSPVDVKPPTAPVNTHPVSIQIQFRRNLFAFLLLNVFMETALVAAFTYIPFLQKIFDNVFTESEPYVALSFGATLISFATLYFGGVSWLLLVIFHIVFAVFIAGLQEYLDTNAGMLCCVFMLSSLVFMIALCGFRSQNSHGFPVVLSPLPVVLLSYSLSSLCVGGFYAVGITVMTEKALVNTFILELLVMSWFAFEIRRMHVRLTPIEYTNGIVYFNKVLVLTTAVLLLCGCLALYFSSSPNAGYGFLAAFCVLGWFPRCTKDSDADDPGQINLEDRWRVQATVSTHQGMQPNLV